MNIKRIFHTTDTDGKIIVRILIDEAKCNGCGDCVKVCKSRSLEIRDGVCVATKPDECKLCMLCKVTCPERAIEIEV